MRRTVAVVLAVVVLLGWQGWKKATATGDGGGAGPVASMNGDVNGSGAIDISDATYLLNWLFLGGPDPVAFAQGGRLTAEETALLKEILPHLSIEQLPALTVGQGNVIETAKAIRFTGVNVQIVNGLGAIHPDEDKKRPTNGLGNLVVGYNEFSSFQDRTGSHNVVVGILHRYPSYGGLVVGFNNTISGPYASVSGGSFNTASRFYSTVSGGIANTACGVNSSVSGGSINTASGRNSSVTGGQGNVATEEGQVVP